MGKFSGANLLLVSGFGYFGDGIVLPQDVDLVHPKPSKQQDDHGFLFTAFAGKKTSKLNQPHFPLSCDRGEAKFCISKTSSFRSNFHPILNLHHKKTKDPPYRKSKFFSWIFHVGHLLRGHYLLNLNPASE